MNPNGAPAGFSSSCQAGAATWGSLAQVAFSFNYQGSTSIATYTSGDGVHAVYWQADGSGMSASTLAVTWSWYSGSTAVHFDMIFNGTHNWSANPASNQFDIQTVALHEFGHALGLGHSNVAGAVMYPSVGAGVVKRSPTADDISGAAAQYPSGTGSAPGMASQIAPSGTISSTTPTYTWNAVSGATSYELLVHPSGQPNPILSVQNIATTSYSTVTPLPGEASYYWWVRARNAAGTGPWSNTFQFTISAPTPGMPSQISPIGPTSVNPPVLTWNAAANATKYEILVNQINGQANIVTQTNIQGTTFTPANPLPAGFSYYWWVRGWNGTKSGLWSNTVSFSFSTTVLGTPTTIAPTGTISTGTPTFSWNAAANATSYDLLVNQSGGASGIISVNAIVGTSYQHATALPAGSSYAWFVRARNGGAVGSWSASTSFTIQGNGPGVPSTIAPTGTPATNPPAFSWSVAANATSYELRVDQVGGAANYILQGGIAGTAYTPGSAFPSGYSYNWWVRAYNGATAGAWSAQASFTIGAVQPGQSSQIAPTGTVTNQRPTFSWTAAANATNYELWVDRYGVQSKIVYQTGISGTSYTPMIDLPVGSTYAWWVRAWNGGQSGPWSNTVFFNIPAPPPPGMPSLLAPTGTIATTRPSFTWSNANGTTYELWVDRYLVQSKIVYQTGLTGTSYTPGADLPSGADYKWWVRAWVGSTAGPWSNTGSFTVPTNALPPGGVGTPVGASPSGTTTSASPTYSWSAAAGATSYEIRVDEVNGATGVVQASGISGTTYSGGAALRIGATYRWFVRATNGTVTSAWSAALQFQTVYAGTPGMSAITSPTGTIATKRPNFSWTAASNATHYELLSHVQGSSTPFFQQQGITGTSFTSPVDFPNNSYNVWVRAWNGPTYGVWSNTFPFTVYVSPQLAAPVLVAPQGRVTALPVNFSWQAVAGAASYELRADEIGGATNVISQSGIAGTTFQATSGLVSGRQYRWWARAWANGLASPWSASMDFDILTSGLSETVEAGANGWAGTGFWHVVTQGSSPFVQVHGGTRSWWYGRDASGNYDDGAANQGTLTSPPFQVPSNGRLTYWSWEATEGGTVFDVRFVQISTDGGATWTNLLQSSDNSSAWRQVSLSISGYAGQTARLRFSFNTLDWQFNAFRGWYLDDLVVATSLAATTGAYSPAGETDRTRPLFSWPAVDGATHYELKVLEAGVDAIVLERTVTETEYLSESPFLPGKAYSWWVRGYRVEDGNRIESPWSARQEFSVSGEGPPAPVGRAPAGEVDQTATVLFEWSPVPGAHHYELRVSEKEGALDVVSRADLAESSIALPGLAPGKRYLWWVRAVSADGDIVSPWSDALEFSVAK
ncbi:MAG: matrixin family metalloprotease [Planctomycetes bacterium]|nr:matrixin family metalloprotease [Planctomycetota bacterium]